MVDQAIQLVARWYNDGKQLPSRALDFVKRAVIENYLAACKGFGDLIRFLRKVFPATMTILKDVMTTVKASSPGENVPGSYPNETEVSSVKPDANEPESAKVVSADPAASSLKRSHSTMAAVSQPARVPEVSPVRSRPTLDEYATAHPVLRAMQSPQECMDAMKGNLVLDGLSTADPGLLLMQALKESKTPKRRNLALDGHPTARLDPRGLQYPKDRITPTRGRLALGGYSTGEHFPRGTYLHQGSDQINKKARPTESPRKSTQDAHQLQPLGGYWAANLPAILDLDGRELPLRSLQELTPPCSEICRRFVQSINAAYQATGAMVHVGPKGMGLAVKVKGQDQSGDSLITAIWNDKSEWISVAFRDEHGNPMQQLDPMVLRQLQCIGKELDQQSIANDSDTNDDDDDRMYYDYEIDDFVNGPDCKAVVAAYPKIPSKNTQEDVIMADQGSNNDDGGGGGSGGSGGSDGGGGGRAISTNAAITAAQMAASVQGPAQPTGHGAGGTDVQRTIPAPAMNAPIDSVMSDAPPHETAGDHAAASSSFDLNFTASAPVPTFGQGAAQVHTSTQTSGHGHLGYYIGDLPLQNQDAKPASTERSVDVPDVVSPGDKNDQVDVDDLCALTNKNFNPANDDGDDEGDGNGNKSKRKRNGGNRTSQPNNSRHQQQRRRR